MFIGMDFNECGLLDMGFINVIYMLLNDLTPYLPLYPTLFYSK